MPKTQLSNEIVIRFAMTKGEGELPSKREITEDEIDIPQSICSFLLDLDYGKFDDALDPIGLTEVVILYDGIENYYTVDNNGEYENNGLYWDSEEECFSGYPEPIIKFKFSKPVNKEVFLSLVTASSVYMCSQAQQDKGDGGFYFEDYNGWVQILDGIDLARHLKFINDSDLFSGRTFKYIEDDHIFPLSRG